MKDIKKMVEKFNYKRVKNSIFGFKPHDAIIGEWIRWWLNDSRLGDKRERRVINPAICATYRKKRYIADLLFLEKDYRGHYWKVLGVAEIENNKGKLLSKLTSLKAYDHQITKFPDLKFTLLSTRFLTQDEKLNNSDSKLVSGILNKISNISIDSDRIWCFHILKMDKFEDDEEFRVPDYVKGYDRFFYTHAFWGEPYYVIAENGEIIRVKGEIKKVL